MNPQVRRLVCWSVVISLKGREVTLPMFLSEHCSSSHYSAYKCPFKEIFFQSFHSIRPSVRPNRTLGKSVSLLRIVDELKGDLSDWWRGYLKRMWPRLVTWYTWFNTTQVSYNVWSTWSRDTYGLVQYRSVTTSSQVLHVVQNNTRGSSGTDQKYCLLIP